MDRKLIRYYLGAWADAPLQEPALRIREILLSESIPDTDKPALFFETLAALPALDENSLTILDRGIRGHYGGEQYSLDLSAGEEADFWQRLQQKFPEHTSLKNIAGDALFCAGRSAEAFPLVIAALQADPSLSYSADFCEAVMDSPFRFGFQLFLLRYAETSEALREEIALLENEYATDEAKIRQLKRIRVGGKQV